MSIVKFLAIVDDDPIYQLTSKKTIEYTKLVTTILGFENGSHIYDYLIANADGADNLPDVIFLDLNMPVMDGVTFLKYFSRIKSRLCKNVKVYVVSSSVDPDERLNIRSIPVVADFLEKPLTVEKLKEVLQEISEE